MSPHAPINEELDTMNINKTFTKLLLTVSAVGLLGTSCSSDNDVDRSRTVITDPVVVQNDFDKWLDQNYVAKYNIEMKYRFEDNESQRNRYVAPATYEKSIQFAHLARHLCLEPYDVVTGSTSFIRQLFPKIVQLIGSVAYNTNNTVILGTAEGGRKMVLYRINGLDPTNVEDMNTYYFQTIHHEFGHIQNQTRPYSTEFEQITASAYISDSWNEAWDSPSNIATTVLAELETENIKNFKAYNAEGAQLLAIPVASRTAAQTARIEELRTLIAALRASAAYQAEQAVYDRISGRINKGELSTSLLNALRAGFISPYASSQHAEDFVELQSIYITDDPQLWEDKFLVAGTKGAALLQQKFAIVKAYLHDDWGIDIEALRTQVLERQGTISTLDLNSLTLN